MDWSRHLCAALLAAASFSASSASLTTVGSVPEARRPAGVPPEYVVTPNGLFHPSCVIEVQDGERLSASGAVLQQLDMPQGVGVSGLESDGAGLFYCGGGSSGKVRAVRRPRAGTAA